MSGTGNGTSSSTSGTGSSAGFFANLGVRLCGRNAVRDTAVEIDPAVQRNAAINRQIEQDRIKKQATFQILLFGGRRTGKTTIMRQLKNLQKNGAEGRDYVSYISIIHSNIVESLRFLLQFAEKKEIEPTGEIKDSVMRFMEEVRDTEVHELIITAPLAELIRRIYKSPYYEKVFHLFGYRLEMMESLPYYMENFDRIVSTTYSPTYKDMLFVRTPTTTVEEIEVTINGKLLKVIDGTQSGIPRKWIHHFEQVKCMVFIVDLAAYTTRALVGDVPLLDKEKLSRFIPNKLGQEQHLFWCVMKEKWLKEVDVILFLNKEDLFRERLERISVTEYCKDYRGNNEFKSSVDYIMEEFVDIHKDAVKEYRVKKTLFTHIISAVDTENVRNVFEDIVSRLLEKNLETITLM